MVAQVAINAVQFFRSKGLSKDAAIALVSVLWYESKLKPGSQGSQSTETPGALNSAGAYGIASWNGPRQYALASYAAKKNLPVEDLNTQLAFVLTEMANSYPKSWAVVRSQASYAQIIPTIVAEYENPKDHAKEIAGAMVEAGALYGSIPADPPKPQVPNVATGGVVIGTGAAGGAAAAAANGSTTQAMVMGAISVVSYLISTYFKFKAPSAPTQPTTKGQLSPLDNLKAKRVAVQQALADYAEAAQVLKASADEINAELSNSPSVTTIEHDSQLTSKGS